MVAIVTSIKKVKNCKIISCFSFVLQSKKSKDDRNGKGDSNKTPATVINGNNSMTIIKTAGA